jgi:hypothetical protein
MLPQANRNKTTRVEEYCITTLHARKRFINTKWWRQIISGSPWPDDAYEIFEHLTVPQLSMAGSWVE